MGTARWKGNTGNRGRPVRLEVASPPSFSGGGVQPNKRWTGARKKDQKHLPDLQTGTLYVGIAASHTDHITLKRILKRRSKIPRGTGTIEYCGMVSAKANMVPDKHLAETALGGFEGGRLW